MDEKHKIRSSHKLGISSDIPIYVGKRAPEKTLATIYLYNAKEISQVSVSSTIQIKNHLQKHKGKAWINFTGLADVNWIFDVCQTLNIHQLIIEDILNTEQRPKVELHEDYIYIVLKLCQLKNDRKILYYEQISMLIKENILITFQEKESDYFATVYKKFQLHNSHLLKNNVDYLAYILIDTIIDNYFNVIEEKGDQIEALETKLIINPNKKYLEQLYYLKREYITLHKVVLSLKDIVGILLKEETRLFSHTINVYFRDLYDHCLRIIETIDIYREMLTGMLDIYMSSVNNKINETMRILTIFASIFIPLTFITGIYGMNFKYMPELNYHFGYFIILGVMVIIVVGLLIYFRRKKWI